MEKESNAIRRFKAKVEKHKKEMTLKYGIDYRNNLEYWRAAFERDYEEYEKKIRKPRVVRTPSHIDLPDGGRMPFPGRKY